MRYVSAIGNTGLLRFTVRKEAIAAPTRITFCTRLCQDAARIAVFDLPSYSPERTPDAYRNGAPQVQVAQRVAVQRIATGRRRSLRRHPA